MTFFRAYIAPLLIVLTFVVAMVAVSARIFLPSDMMAPAPVGEPVGILVPRTVQLFFPQAIFPSATRPGGLENHAISVV